MLREGGEGRYAAVKTRRVRKSAFKKERHGKDACEETGKEAR